MGTWGWKIFQNDDACDIRDSYKEKLIVGKSKTEAETLVVNEFSLNDQSELWLPLAITQWNLGILSGRAKENALRWIEYESSHLGEYWNANHIENRKQELDNAYQQLCSMMPKPKKLKAPVWAFKCPWPVGSILQYRLKHLDESSIYANKYVLLLIQGITETPPDSIPCECIAVSLYNWCNNSPPHSLKNEFLIGQPSLIDFLTKSGNYKATHTLLLSKQMIRENDIRCIRSAPFSLSDMSPTPVSAPMNSVFEVLVARTLSSL